MDFLLENLLKVAFAVVAGGIIGAEREFQDKAAGFRTIILITVGSTLFTVLSTSIDKENSLSRIAANIVTGIGFLGAGAIVREGGKIGGLTTAAAIWLAAALGMGIGAGEIYFSLATAIIALLVLLVFPRFEGLIDQAREVRAYRITVGIKHYAKMAEIESALRSHSLRVIECHKEKNENGCTGSWKTIGSPRNQEKFLNLMIMDKQVERIDY